MSQYTWIFKGGRHVLYSEHTLGLFWFSVGKTVSRTGSLSYSNVTQEWLWRQNPSVRIEAETLEAINKKILELKKQ